MKRQPSNERQSSNSETKMRLTRRAKMLLAASAFGVSSIAGGASVYNEIAGNISQHKHELETDVVSYKVEKGGPIWMVASGINPDEDATYMSGVIEDLNPDYAETKLIPDNTIITIPREFLPNDTKPSQYMSVDLDANIATVHR